MKGQIRAQESDMHEPNSTVSTFSLIGLRAEEVGQNRVQ